MKRDDYCLCGCNTNRNYLIYKHTCIVNGKSYIGITNDYEVRCNQHKSNARKGSSIPFHAAIRKHGLENFEHQILVEGLTLEVANCMEFYFIDTFNALKPNGYNLRSGGEVSQHHEETRRKISATVKLANARPETKAKRSAAAKLQFSTPEPRAKLSAAMKLRFSTPEGRAKMSAAQKLAKSTPEYRAKASAAHAKTWRFLNPEGEEVTIYNLKQFCKDNILDQSSMWQVVSGKVTHHKGWKSTIYRENKVIKTWRFLNPDGEEISIYNLKQFCRENNLNNGGMYQVASGKASHHKGWKKAA